MHKTSNNVMQGQHGPARWRRAAPLTRRQRGAFVVMTAVLVVVILALCGLAIDLGRVLNRKVELQTAADNIALFAAKELNGTAAGINNATDVAEKMAAEILYSYNASEVEWNNAAISFATTPYGGTWLDATNAATPSNAPNLFYVKVDMSRLAAAHGEVPLTLLRLLPTIGSSARVNVRATAGRASINVLPLALCAMSNTAAADRNGELVEYGFRRGINYDLMKLNPNGTAKGANYLINPTALPGATGASVKEKIDIVRPFICTGTLAIPRLTSGNITVEPDFPLDLVYQQLNSRFGSYTAPCNAQTAPPDTNTKQFTFEADFPWMKDTLTQQSAKTATTTTQLLTIADLPVSAIPGSSKPDEFGPLWAYAKAVKYDSYTAGLPEPSAGYTTFSATDSDWAKLYMPAPPKIKPGSLFPSPSPYGFAPTSSATNKRRILNVPLLHCPVPTGSPAGAEVLAIAKFFMTVSAKEHELHAEFAGIAPLTSLVGEMELYP